MTEENNKTANQNQENGNTTVQDNTNEKNQPMADENEVVEEKDELTLLKEANKELEEKMLRTLAEHENFRKAMFKESDKKVNIAVRNMVSKFLSVMGAFNQGIKAAESSNDIAGVLSGMKMIETMFGGALNDIGVKEIDAKEGVMFDPNFHQPISRVESSEHPENTILNVVAKGYTLNGLLVQPAMVVVSHAPVKKSDESAENEKAEDAVE